MTPAHVLDLGTEPDPAVVMLRDGREPVAVAALCVMWTAEDRGAVIRLEGGRLVCQPRELFGDDDIATIRRYRRDVKRLVAYRAPED